MSTTPPPPELDEISQIELAIIEIVKAHAITSVVRDDSFDTSSKTWWTTLCPENTEQVHAWVIGLTDWEQKPSAAGYKQIEPVFGIDLLRQYDLAGASRTKFYSEFLRVSNALSKAPDLGLARIVSKHDEMQGSRIGTRTIGGVKLHVFPTTLTVRLKPVSTVR